VEDRNVVPDTALIGEPVLKKVAFRKMIGLFLFMLPVHFDNHIEGLADYIVSGDKTSETSNNFRELRSSTSKSLWRR
jgi:hypothetical protein